MIEAFIIITLVLFLGYREWRHEVHTRELEDKLFKSNPEVYWRTHNEGKKPAPNDVMKQDDNEVMLNDIPFMELPKEYNIQTEGSSETPAEELARGGNNAN